MITKALFTTCFFLLTTITMSAQAMLHPRNFDLQIGIGGHLPFYVYMDPLKNTRVATPSYGFFGRVDFSYQGETKFGFNIPFRIFFEDVTFQGYEEPFYNFVNFSSNAQRELLGVRKGNYHVEGATIQYGIGVNYRANTRSSFHLNLLYSELLEATYRFRYVQSTERFRNIETGEYENLIVPIESTGTRVVRNGTDSRGALEASWLFNLSNKSQVGVLAAISIWSGRNKQHRLGINYSYKIF